MTVSPEIQMVLGALLGIVGLATLGWALFAIVRDGRKSRWAYVKGEMLSGEAIPTAKASKYRMKVLYTFEVDGRRYESSNFGLLDRNFDKQQADRHARRYSPGSVPVRYNAKDPAQAYLDSTESQVPMVLGGVGVALILAAVWMVRGYLGLT